MKPGQIALLGGMALLDCLVLIGGLAIVFGSLSSRSANQVAGDIPTATSIPTDTAVTAPTVTTDTALPPTEEPSATPEYLFATWTPNGIPTDSPTPSPSATSSMEGWVKFSVKEVEMWMPGSYAAGNPHTDAKAIIASLKEKGADFNFTAIQKDLSTASKNYVFWGIDSVQGNPAIVTNVAVLYDYPSAGEPLADYARRFIGEMSGDFTLIEQNSITSPVYEIDQVILETKSSEGTPTRLILYAIRDHNIIWDVICITGVDEMKARLSSFNLMVDTFRAIAAPQ
jgi:hypothetical protein